MHREKEKKETFTFLFR